MKKKILLLVLTVLMVLPVQVQAAEISDVSPLSSSITPFWTYTELKSITKQYKDRASIPQSIYYEYYNKNVKSYMRGTLKKKEVTESSGSSKITVMFQGTLYSSPL